MHGVQEFCVVLYSNLNSKLSASENYAVSNSHEAYVVNELTTSMISISIHSGSVDFILPKTNKVYILMLNYGLNADESGLILFTVRNETFQKTIIKEPKSSSINILTSNTTIGIYFTNLDGVITLIP